MCRAVWLADDEIFLKIFVCLFVFDRIYERDGTDGHIRYTLCGSIFRYCIALRGKNAYRRDPTITLASNLYIKAICM